MKKRYQIQWIMFMILVVSMSMLQAQDSAEELSQQAANPIANLISLPFQNNANFGFGPFDRTTNILNIQPVVPLANGKIVTRTIFPIVWIPDYGSESGSYSSGLSDITFTAFYVPESKNVIWGVGPVFDIPTGGEKRGSQKWNIGPSFLALVQPGDWTFGILANNVWSFAGKSEAPDVNRGLINLFIVRQLGEGWYVNSAPIITVDWKASSGQQWIVPLGVGAGKLLFVGKLPLNVQVGYYYNIVKPDFGPKSQLRVQAQILLPTSIFGG
jgi:hypothetical protein